MNLMRYLLEANLYLAAFYLLYLFLLRKETYYQLSRAYLLAASAISFIIPLLQLGILKPQADTLTSVQAVPQITFGEMQALPVIAPAPVAHSWTALDYSLLVYGIIASAMVINLGIKIYKLISLSKKNATQSKGDFVLVEVEGENAAFSFFGYLFVDAKLAASATVIRHEQVHIRQKHSWDIIYTELLKIVNWFNPFVYLMQNSLKELHEFIADQHTAELENSNDNYAAFLISSAYGVQPNVLTNSFSGKNMLRKRIVMLYQKRSGRLARLKYLVALPLIGALLCISTMAFTDKSYGLVDILPQHIQTQLAQFKLGRALFKHRNNIALIDTAKLGNKTITALVLDRPNANDNAIPAKADSNKHPIIIANGERLKAPAPGSFNYNTAEEKDYAALWGLSASEIKSISILKNKDAEALYGADAANGVIIVTTTEYGRGWLHAMNNPTEYRKLNVNGANGTVLSQRFVPTTRDSASDQVFTAVEVEPTPKDGMAGFYQFLSGNIRYPKEDREKGIQGRVIVQMIIEKDGTIDDIKVMRAPSPALGEEAVRVLKSAPKWNPGLQNGKPVAVQYTIPVNFALEPKVILPPPPSATPNTDLNMVFTAVEIEPTPKGGMDNFYTFLSKNIKYPSADKDNMVQGRVIAQFVVEKDGSFSDIKVLRRPSETIAAEAVRVLSMAPKWNPGIQNGRTVRVQYTIPINFSLADIDNFGAFYKQLVEKIKYPAEAKEKGIVGRTIVTFTLDDNKQFKDIRVVRGINKAVDEEVSRAIQNCKQLANGQTGVLYAIPFNFALRDKDNKYVDGTADKSYVPPTYSTKQNPTMLRTMLSEVVITGYK